MRRSSAFAALFIACVAAPALAKIHPGDRVAVLVYNHPELSGQTTVDGSGHISLPLAGGVDTTNLDPSQVAQRVRYRLADARSAADDDGVAVGHAWPPSGRGSFHFAVMTPHGSA